MASESNDGKPKSHLLVIVGGLILLLNSLVIGISLSNQDSKKTPLDKNPEIGVKLSETAFVIKNDEVYHRGNRLDWSAFIKQLDICKDNQMTLELFFDEKTVTDEFEQNILKIVREKQLWPCRQVYGAIPEVLKK